MPLISFLKFCMCLIEHLMPSTVLAVLGAGDTEVSETRQVLSLEDFSSGRHVCDGGGCMHGGQIPYS